jgi:hypothetical protein
VRKQFPRRKRLLIRYAVLGLVIVAAAVVVVFRTRPSPKPYTPGEQLEGVTSSLGREIPQDYPRIIFTEVGKQSGIDFTHFAGSRSSQLPEDMGSGAAWGDYDGDGDFDLYVCNFAGPLTMDPANSGASNKLYRNNGDGTFTDVTKEAGVDFRGYSMAAAWGDYDGDRDLDLWVTNFGTSILYRNNGDDTFTDITEMAGVAGVEGFWTGVSWSDYDRDGDLDIYICGYVQYRFDPLDTEKVSFQYQADIPFTLNPSSYRPERNLLYRNNGDGTFTEVATESGVDNASGRSLSAAWCDFDLDGWPDLYIANDISDNAMFKNLGDGRFVDVSHDAFVADYRGAMGLGVGDWDNDGDYDIFITHWIAQENALLNNLLYAFGEPEAKAERMFFMDISDHSGLGQIALDFVGWGTSFFDYDNDGLQDLLVVNGSTFQDRKDPKVLIPMRDLLFWNQGEEKGFFEVGQVSGTILGEQRVGRGAAFADYDDDGDVDVFVVNNGGPAMLLRNDGGNRQNWLKVRLRGSGKNSYGLGAQIELLAKGKRQIQELGAQSSYLSQNAFEAHFGLGQLQQVEKLTVVFPSGKKVSREGLVANQTVLIQENE